MSGIMALKRGGRGGKKSSKFKKQAKKRYDERRADIREQARSNQGSQQDNTKQTQKTGLEALIDRKDELKNISANDGSGRNQYQVEMNKFKSTPGGNKIFKKRFPNPLVKAAQGIGNYIKQGGALGILANSLGGGKKIATGFGKDASNMAKDLAGMFGLDGLMGKLVNIAGGRDTNDFNKVIQNNQTSTRMRNNLAYGDPLGLNNAPIYRDPIMDMGLPNIDTSMEDQYRQFLSTTDKNIGAGEEAMLAGSEPYNPSDPEKQAMEQSLTPGEINLSAINDLVNLRTNDEDIFEDVSETNYNNIAPNYDFSNFKINEELSNQGVDPNSFPEGGVPGKGVTQAGEQLFFADGTPITEQFDTGLTTVGDSVFPSSPGSQTNLDILNSNATDGVDFSGYPTMGFGFANGGYMSGFSNQNPAESLTASDNIDDRIMKNLQFEKMAPGMMGYNQGGKVMNTYDKLKAIADNNYG